jgi:hypothetical protein
MRVETLVETRLIASLQSRLYNRVSTIASLQSRLYNRVYIFALYLNSMSTKFLS